MATSLVLPALRHSIACQLEEVYMAKTMSAKRKESFLRKVAQENGQSVADRCKTILEENPDLSAMAIVQRALSEVVPDVDEKKLAEARFDSWPKRVHKEK